MAGRRQCQREPGHHDEHDDREPPVDERGGPERRVVDRVAGEGAQEHVVHHHEQRGEAADAVQAGEPLSRRRGHGEYALRKRSRNALIGQTGALGLGRRPFCQRQPPILSSTAGSCAITEIGTSWEAPCPLMIVSGWWSPRTTSTRFLSPKRWTNETIALIV